MWTLLVERGVQVRVVDRPLVPQFQVRTFSSSASPTARATSGRLHVRRRGDHAVAVQVRQADEEPAEQQAADERQRQEAARPPAGRGLEGVDLVAEGRPQDAEPAGVAARAGRAAGGRGGRRPASRGQRGAAGGGPRVDQRRWPAVVGGGGRHQADHRTAAPRCRAVTAGVPADPVCAPKLSRRQQLVVDPLEPFASGRRSCTASRPSAGRRRGTGPAARRPPAGRPAPPSARRGPPASTSRPLPPSCDQPRDAGDPGGHARAPPGPSPPAARSAAPRGGCSGRTRPSPRSSRARPPASRAAGRRSARPSSRDQRFQPGPVVALADDHAAARRSPRRASRGRDRISTSNAFSGDSRPTAPTSSRPGRSRGRAFASAGGRAGAYSAVSMAFSSSTQFAAGTPGRQARLEQVVGHADHPLVPRQAEPVDPVVQRRAGGVLHPAVDGGHQPHRAEPLEQQAEGVRLVVVAVPDGDVLAAAARRAAPRRPASPTARGPGSTTSGASYRGRLAARSPRTRGRPAGAGSRTPSGSRAVRGTAGEFRMVLSGPPPDPVTTRASNTTGGRGRARGAGGGVAADRRSGGDRSGGGSATRVHGRVNAGCRQAGSRLRTIRVQERPQAPLPVVVLFHEPPAGRARAPAGGPGRRAGRRPRRPTRRASRRRAGACPARPQGRRGPAGDATTALPIAIASSTLFCNPRASRSGTTATAARGHVRPHVRHLPDHRHAGQPAEPPDRRGRLAADDPELGVRVPPRGPAARPRRRTTRPRPRSAGSPAPRRTRTPAPSARRPGGSSRGPRRWWRRSRCPARRTASYTSASARLTSDTARAQPGSARSSFRTRAAFEPVQPPLRPAARRRRSRATSGCPRPSGPRPPAPGPARPAAGTGPGSTPTPRPRRTPAPPPTRGPPRLSGRLAERPFATGSARSAG